MKKGFLMALAAATIFAAFGCSGGGGDEEGVSNKPTTTSTEMKDDLGTGKSEGAEKPATD